MVTGFPNLRAEEEKRCCVCSWNDIDTASSGARYSMDAEIICQICHVSLATLLASQGRHATLQTTTVQRLALHLDPRANFPTLRRPGRA
jgi:hypothetical protein